MIIGLNIRGAAGTVGLRTTTLVDGAIDPDLGNGGDGAVQEHRIRKTARPGQMIEGTGGKETVTATAAAAGIEAGSETTRGDIEVVVEIGTSVEAGEARMAGHRDGRLDPMEGITPSPAAVKV